MNGDCYVAIAAPSWCSRIRLDLDRPKVFYAPGERYSADKERAADLERDRVLAAVWRAFKLGGDRVPVIQLSPGGGYHVDFPHVRFPGASELERTFPLSRLRQHYEHALDRAGVGLHPGRLELYPCARPLRAPCGRGMAVLVPRHPDNPEDLGLEPVHAVWRERELAWTGGGELQLVKQGVLVRVDVDAQVEDYIERIESARRPVEEWLEPAPQWRGWDREAGDATWGPWARREKTAPFSDGKRVLYQHIEDYQDSGGLPPGSLGAFSGSGASARHPGRHRLGGGRREGHLLYGEAFVSRIEELTTKGVTALGTRHDGVLKLAYHLFVKARLSVGGALDYLRTWLGGLPHLSKDLRRASGVKKSLQEAEHYLRLLDADPEIHRRRRGASRAWKVRQLGDADRLALARCVPEGVRSEAEVILSLLVAFADDTGRVGLPVTLSAAVEEEFCGQRRVICDGQKRRAVVLAREALLSAGLLTVDVDYSTGHHARRYCVWYRFGSGEVPRLEARAAWYRLDVGGVLKREDSPVGLVVAARMVEGGVALAVLEGLRRPVGFRFVSNASDVTPGASSWWFRMYGRRTFTPAEFFAADRRSVLPGPFRDRWPTRRSWTKAAGRPSGRPPPAGPGGGVDAPPSAVPPVMSPVATTAVPLQEHDRGAHGAVATVGGPVGCQIAPCPNPTRPAGAPAADIQDADLREQVKRMNGLLQTDWARVVLAWEKRSSNR